MFNLLAGLALLAFYRPVIAAIGWPDTETPIYANVLGAALIGLSMAVILAPRVVAGQARTTTVRMSTKRPVLRVVWCAHPFSGGRPFLLA